LTLKRALLNFRYEGGGDIDGVPSLRLRRGLSDEARSTRHGM
jgi:hypothetical protein